MSKTQNTDFEECLGTWEMDEDERGTKGREMWLLWDGREDFSRTRPLTAVDCLPMGHKT